MSHVKLFWGQHGAEKGDLVPKMTFLTFSWDLGPCLINLFLIHRTRCNECCSDIPFLFMFLPVVKFHIVTINAKVFIAFKI